MTFYVLMLIEWFDKDNIHDSSVNSFFWSRNRNIVLEYRDMMEAIDVDFVLLIYEYQADSTEECYKKILADFKDLKDLMAMKKDDHMSGSELVIYQFKSDPSKYTIIPRDELDDAKLYQEDSEEWLDSAIVNISQLSVLLKLLRPEQSKPLMIAIRKYVDFIKDINATYYSSRRHDGKFGLYPLSDFIDPVAVYTRIVMGCLPD